MRLQPRARLRRVANDVPSISGSLSGVLVCGLKRALRNEPIVRSAKARLEKMGLIRTRADRFSELTQLGLDVLRYVNASGRCGLSADPSGLSVTMGNATGDPLAKAMSASGQDQNVQKPDSITRKDLPND